MNAEADSLFETNKIAKGLIWKHLERSVYQITLILVTLILARILSPEEYGAVALVVAIVSILQAFVDSGMGVALIQKKNVTEKDFSTVFFTNIFLSLCIYALVFFVSPYISRIYGKDLTVIIRILSIVIIVFGVKNVFLSHIVRSFQFRKIFISSITSVIFGGIVGITMAIYRFGVWALVFQQLVNEISYTAILVKITGWKPRFTFSFSSLKNIFGFGWKLLLSSIIDTLYNNIRQLMIGKYYSSGDLAYYSKGEQIPNVLANNINTTFNSVLLPVMSQYQDNRQAMKDITRRIIKVSSFVILPMMFGLMAISNNLIYVLLTEKWLPTVPYLCILSFAYCLQPLQTTNLNVLKAIGRTDIYLKLEIIKKIIAFSLVIISVKFGVIFVALSAVLYSVIASIINSFPNKEIINYSYLEQLKDIVPSLFLSFVMGVTVYGIGYILNCSVVLKLIVQVILGIALYVFGSILLKFESYYYILNVAKQLVSDMQFKKILLKLRY